MSDEVLPEVGERTLAQYAARYTEALREKERLEAELTAANQMIMKLNEQIAEHMIEVGISKFTLQDGREISYGVEWRGSINLPGRGGGVNPAAIQWLEDNGHDGILRENVVVHFARGQRDPKKVHALEKFLEKSSYDFERGIDCAWNTLAAFIRDQVEAGEEVSPELRPTSYYKVRIKGTK